MNKILICLGLFLMVGLNASANINSIHWISQSTAQQGEYFHAVVRGDNSPFAGGDQILFFQGSTVVFYSEQGTIDGNGGDTLFTNVQVPNFAPSGNYILAIASQSDCLTGDGICNNCFTVITSNSIKVSPSNTTIGKNIKVDISGLKTHFSNKGQGTKVWLNKLTIQGTNTVTYGLTKPIYCDSVNVINDTF